MHILRYLSPGSASARVGVLMANGRVAELDGVASLGWLWALPLEHLRERLEATLVRGAPSDKDVPSEVGETIERLGAFLGAKEVVYTSRVPAAWKPALR